MDGTHASRGEVGGEEGCSCGDLHQFGLCTAGGGADCPVPLDILNVVRVQPDDRGGQSESGLPIRVP